MYQKPRKIKRQGARLTKPEVQYVSLVDHGANQTPLVAVKRHEEIEMSRTGDAKVKKDTGGSSVPGVRKMVFSASKFADAAAVDAFLKANDWEGYEIVSSEGGDFTVEQKGITDDDFVNLKTIDMPDAEGVTVTIGHLAAADDEEVNKTASEEETVTEKASADADDDEDEGYTEVRPDKDEKPKKAAAEPKIEGEEKIVDKAPEPKAEETDKSVDLVVEFSNSEVVRKYSDYYGEYKDPQTFAEGMKNVVLSDYGSMPGLYDIMSVYRQVLRSALKSDDPVNQIAALNSEFGSLIQSLATVYIAMLASDTSVAASVIEKMFSEPVVTASHSDDTGTQEVEITEMNEELKKAINEAVVEAVGTAVTAAVEAINKAQTEGAETVAKMAEDVANLREQVEKGIKAEDESTKKSIQKPPVSNSVADTEPPRTETKKSNSEDEAAAALDRRMKMNAFGNC